MPPEGMSFQEELDGYVKMLKEARAERRREKDPAKREAIGWYISSIESAIYSNRRNFVDWAKSRRW
jgi:hypothetical protein